jgi:hypothetical protein
MCGGVSVLADWVCALDFGVLEASDAVVVVVDGCLKDCSPFHQPSLYPKVQQSKGEGGWEKRINLP